MARNMTLGKDFESDLVYRFNGKGDILCYYAPSNFSFKPPTGVWLRFPDDFGRLIFEQNCDYTRQYKSYLSNLQTYGISCSIGDGIDVEYGTYKDWKDANCLGYGCAICASWFEKTDKTPVMPPPDNLTNDEIYKNGVLFTKREAIPVGSEINADSIQSGVLNNTFDLKGKGLLAKEYKYTSGYPFFLIGMNSIFYMCSSTASGIGVACFSKNTPSGADSNKYKEYYSKWIEPNIIDGRQVWVDVGVLGSLIVDFMSCYTNIANRTLSAQSYQSMLASPMWRWYIAYKSSNKNNIDNTYFEVRPYKYVGDPDFKNKYWLDLWKILWGNGD